MRGVSVGRGVWQDRVGTTTWTGNGGGEVVVGSCRALVVVAHPDDETFGCGSFLLDAAARGVTTYVCCATRGEAGEPARGVTRDALPEVREQELHAAADLLGVEEVTLLGFRDSGMSGDPHADALVRSPVEVVADEIAAVIDRFGPHVVVTLDGSDGHRDHVHVRDATIAAVDRCEHDVQRLYLQCLPRSLLRRWAEHMRLVQPDSPYLDVDGAGLGTPDEELTTVFATLEHLERRRAAIAVHASQVSPYDELPEDLARSFLAIEHLRRLRPAGGGGIETDPYAEVALDGG